MRAFAPSEQSTVSQERALFFRHWLKKPLGIGAILPSTAAVARAMARELQLSRPGIILELGGGTGTITRGLLDHGCPPERLVVVEREPALVEMLRQRFPQLSVVEGDACNLAPLFDRLGITQIATVISSLPIKWFPLAAQQAVATACFDRLGPGGPMLQLTNALVSPMQMARLGLTGTEVARIWAQFPPVQIWRYQRVSAAEAR